MLDGGRIVLDGSATAVLEDPRLVELGVEPPSRVRLARAMEARGIDSRLVEINPANAAEVTSFALPMNAVESGLAIHPLTGNLWYGADSGTNVVELSRTGAVLRTVDLALQGVNDPEITGLAFDAAGNLLVASDQGVVYRLSVS